MEYPQTQEDLVCELETFLHQGVMSSAEHKMFKEFIQIDFKAWLTFCGEDCLAEIFGNLHTFLIVGAQLYKMEHFDTLILNALSARRPMHQLRAIGEEQDTSAMRDHLTGFLTNAADVLAETDDMNTAMPQQEVFEYFAVTPNKYLIINLMLCALSDGYQGSYQDYVRGKVSRYTFTLAFWRPFDSLFKEDCALSHMLWMDLLCDLVGPKMSSARFRKMVGESR